MQESFFGSDGLLPGAVGHSGHLPGQVGGSPSLPGRRGTSRVTRRVCQDCRATVSAKARSCSSCGSPNLAREQTGATSGIFGSFSQCQSCGARTVVGSASPCDSCGAPQPVHENPMLFTLGNKPPRQRVQCCDGRGCVFCAPATRRRRTYRNSPKAPQSQADVEALPGYQEAYNRCIEMYGVPPDGHKVIVHGDGPVTEWRVVASYGRQPEIHYLTDESPAEGSKKRNPDGSPRHYKHKCGKEGSRGRQRFETMPDFVWDPIDNTFKTIGGTLENTDGWLDN